MGLVEVLQDDGDVHVDNDHEVDDDERHEEDDGDEGEATVAVWQILVLWITVGGLEEKKVFYFRSSAFQKLSDRDGLCLGVGWELMATVLVTFKLSYWAIYMSSLTMTFVKKYFDMFVHIYVDTCDMRGSSTSFQPAEVTSLEQTNTHQP